MLIDINYFSNFLGYAVGLRSHHMLVLTDPGMGWMCTQRNSFLSEELTMLCWWACLLKMWPLRQQQEAHLRHRHKGRVQTLQSYWTRICILNGVPLFGMCNTGEACWSIGPYLLRIWIHSAYSKSWASFVVQMIICLQCRKPGFNPWLGRSPGEGNGNPLQDSCLENSMDRGVERATVHGITKSQIRLCD